MHKKKIIISLYDDLNNTYYGGGGAVVVHEIAKRLVPFYEIVVLTGNYKQASNMIKDGVRYKRIGPSFLGPKAGQLAFQLLLPMYLRKESFDLWVESFTPPFSTAFLPLFTKKPIVGFVQMLSSEDMQRKYKLPFHLVERLGLRTYTYFIVFTKENKQKIQKVNTKALCFLHSLGIDHIPSQALSPKGDYILFLGRLEFDQKGLDLLLDAYALIASDMNLPLVIAGSGTKKDESLLKDSIRNHRLEKKVVLAGKVTGKKKDKLLRNSALVVIPSRFDSFVLVALEAMAYGKPLVGFTIDGLAWIPAQCMAKVPAFDTRKMATIIKRIAADTSLQQTMSQNGKEFAKRFLWDELIKDYHERFAALLKERRLDHEHEAS